MREEGDGERERERDVWILRIPSSSEQFSVGTHVNNLVDEP